MTAPARRRRTVGEVDRRIADAVARIEAMRDEAAQRQEAAPDFTARSYEQGQKHGFDSALFLLRHALAPEQDWMYQR